VVRRTIIQRRRMGHWALALGIPTAICVLMIASWEWGRGVRGPIDYAAGALVIGIVTIMVVRELRAGKRLAILIRSDWSRCLYCFFDLRGLTHKGDCPECGQRYEIERVRRTWRQGMRAEAKGRGERMAEAD
jgi:hypothetical protein